MKREFHWGNDPDLAMREAIAFRDELEADLKNVWCDVLLSTDSKGRRCVVTWI